MSGKLMPFVDLDDMQQGLPPFFFENLGIRTFLLPADLLKLWVWCDKVLNVSPDHRFYPLGPFVLFGLNSYPKMETLHPDFAGKVGYTSQKEYYFTFPVLHFRRQWGIWIPREITWAYPYIGVDNPTSAFTGREVLGFSKTIGPIAYQDDPNTGKFRGSVSMPGFRKLGPQIPEETLKLAAVATNAPLMNPPTTGAPKSFIWGHVQAALDKGLVGGLINQLTPVADLVEDIVVNLLETLDPSLFSVINLKQFRHPATPLLASYQSLDTCRFVEMGLSPVTVYDGGMVTLWDNPTTSPVSILGIGGPNAAAAATTSAGAKITPLYVAGATTDMWFGEAQTIWSCP